MNRFFTLFLAASCLTAVGQYPVEDGLCCDLDGVNYNGPAVCSGVGEPTGTYSEDGVACDPDCSNYDPCNPSGECYNPSSPGCTTVGCTNSLACNYDSTALFDDGSCIYPSYPCDDGDDLTLNDAIGDDCICEGVIGVSVTFTVDMNLISQVSDQGVYIAGTFQGWDAETTMLTDNGDGTWSTTLDVSPGYHEFKFINGMGWNGGEEQMFETPCSGNIDYGNRGAEFDAENNTYEACFNICPEDPCIPDPPPAYITFQIDASERDLSGESIFLFGSFTGWQGGAIEMAYNGEGKWRTSALVSGSATVNYLYSIGYPVGENEETGRYTIGLDSLGLDSTNFEAAGCGIPNGFGGYIRRFIRSGEDEIIPLHCFNSCAGCNGEGCMDPDACNYSAEAQFEDNSCHYLCQACLDGTTWSEELQGCVVDGQVDGCSLIYDGDNDGLVGSSDLLGLLTEFGAECTPETAFTCGNPVSYQGYDYETVQIGEQCWFAENLRAQNYRNGDVIPAGLSDSEWENTTQGATAVYGEGSSQCFSYSPNGDACDEVWSLTEYGRLYNWYAVDDSRGLCPSEWHIPSDEEWMTMEIFLGMSPSDANGTGWRGTDQGVQMRSVNELCSGTNSSGFSGILGGQRYPYGSFSSGGSAGYWWSSSPIGESAWERNLLCADEVFRYGEEQKSGFSIRCLKD